MSFSAPLAGERALALMWPSATHLLGREHVFSHEVFDLLEDGLSSQRLPEQSVVRSRCHGPAETRRWLEGPGKPLQTTVPSVLLLLAVRQLQAVLVLAKLLSEY